MKPPKTATDELHRRGYRCLDDWKQFRGGDFWTYGERAATVYLITIAVFTGGCAVEVLKNHEYFKTIT